VRMLGGTQNRRSPAAAAAPRRASFALRLVERLSRIAAAWF
jgi:hypothetical protein